jgi:hypothetical protein
LKQINNLKFSNACTVFLKKSNEYFVLFDLSEFIFLYNLELKYDDSSTSNEEFAKLVNKSPF